MATEYPKTELISTAVRRPCEDPAVWEHPDEAWVAEVHASRGDDIVTVYTTPIYETVSAAVDDAERWIIHRYTMMKLAEARGWRAYRDYEGRVMAIQRQGDILWVIYPRPEDEHLYGVGEFRVAWDLEYYPECPCGQ